MKIEDLFLSILKEQDEPNDVDFIFGEPEDPEQPQRAQQQRPQQPKPLSANQQLIVRVKEKWKAERPEIDNDDMENAIQFFNNRKNGIRPLKDPPPQGHPNQLEIIALQTRFPAMTPILTDPVRIRDIQNFTWEQIQYYIDRATAVEMEEEINYEIDETSEQTAYESALEKWTNFPKKIINENNVIVCKVESKEEAMALGRLQNLMAKKYRGSAWCITYRPDRYGHLSNNWTPYRKEGRAFYFILDQNKPESDEYHMGAIETLDPGKHRRAGNHYYTPQPNGTKTGLSWEQIVQFHKTRLPNGQTISPLEGKEHLFPYFGLTPKETNAVELDKITFREGSPNDFVLQTKRIQQKYVEDPNRSVNNKRAFNVLTADLRRSYVGATTTGNLGVRYRCDDPADPFGILNMVAEDRQLYKSLEWKIINELHVPEGIMAIQKPILKLGMKEGLNDIEKKLVLYKQRDGELYGVINMQTVRWEKPIAYIKSEPLSLFKTEEGKMNRFRISRYTLPNAQDWFYFMYNIEAFTNPKSPNYMVGKYMTKEEGDDFRQNLSNYGFRSLGR